MTTLRDLLNDFQKETSDLNTQLKEFTIDSDSFEEECEKLLDDYTETIKERLIG